MKIKFWGVRGSLPVPMTPPQLRRKISAVVNMLTTDDLVSPEAKELFIEKLPKDLFAIAGGNTACVEILCDQAYRLVFDSGTGIRELGNEIVSKKDTKQINLFFSHFHWDHIMGLPFFAPAYIPGFEINFHHPFPGLRRLLEGQMTAPYFPVTMDIMLAKKQFVTINGPVRLAGGVTVNYRSMNHPNGSFCYCVSHAGKRVIYATDVELSDQDFADSPENKAFFENVDTIVLDSQYTLGEAIEKYRWGHSSFSLAVDFVHKWNIKKLLLFHHDPNYDEQKIYNNFTTAQWYLQRLGSPHIQVLLAREGSVIEV